MDTTPPNTTPRVLSARTSETHTARVSLALEGAPVHRTGRTGRSPMTPRHLHLEYVLPDSDGAGGYGLHAELIGPPVREPRWGEGYIPNMCRRVKSGQLEEEPQWLLDLIETHRPASWRGEVPGYPRVLATADGAQ